MRFFLLAISFLLILADVYCQSVINVHATQDDQQVIISYDLEGKSPTERFNISLLSSINNFTLPLKEVEGEIGNGIRPGKGLTITWNAQKETGGYSGDVTFEIDATPMAGYYQFLIPASARSFKKGKSMNITWQGGQKSESINIELLKSNHTVLTLFSNASNTGSVNWIIPKNLKPSRGYQLKISQASDPEFSGISSNFNIASKLPAGYVIIPGAIVLGAVAYLVTKSPNNPSQSDNSLPEPPVTPTSQ